MKQIFNRIRELGIMNKLRFSSQELLQNAVIALDGMQGKLLVINGIAKDKYDEALIDLDDLNPSTHTGHISLYNNQFTIGPSVIFGAFTNSSFPVRLSVGYDWAVYSGKWKSEVAEVDNSFRENGQGIWYARLVLPL